MAECVGHFKSLGFAPRTVIDVGAASGTFELYDAFPRASHLLIEPLAEWEDDLKRVCRKYKAEYIIAAASNEKGTRVMHVHPEPYGSSLMQESEGEHADGFSREVETITVDEVSRDRGLEGPFAIKVDVQGAELIVLQGARKTLSEAELVILEVSLLGAFIGGPELYELVSFMKERGFVAYDVFGGNFRPLDGALARLDIAFVRENGQFRKSHAYASPDQRVKIIADALSRIRTPHGPG